MRLYEDTVEVTPAYFRMKIALRLAVYNVQEMRLHELIFTLFSICIAGSEE
jgi:hypothetical protein